MNTAAQDSFVSIVGDTIRYSIENVQEGKIALKELKLHKREFCAQKKSIIAQQKQIRAEYTHDVRSRGSMVRGRGAIFGFFRAMQSILRDSKRAGLAQALAPLENKKLEIDAMIDAIERLSLKLESKLLHSKLN